MRLLKIRGLALSGSQKSSVTFLHVNGQAHRRGRARPPQEPRPVPRLEGQRPESPEPDVELGHHYLPTSVRGVWLYLYLGIDVWSRKVVAWDVAERKDAQIAADLVGCASLRERITKSRPQPLILHADNGNAMRAATLGCSAQSSTGRTTSGGPYAARKRPAAGWRNSWSSTTTSTATAQSGS